MQVLPLEIPDTTYRLWEQLSTDEKLVLETRLKRAFRAFLFEKNSAVIQQSLHNKGPYQSEEELYDGVS